jgi:hypothetical protein
MKERERPLATAAILTGAALLIAGASCSLKQGSRTSTSGAGPAERVAAVPAKNGYYAKSAASFVANPFCRACHLDFDEEELTLDHELAGIGCERCHGESLRHRSDEANVTPPELMYPKERIDPACMSCHPRQAIQHVQDHRPGLEAALSIFETATPGEQTKQYCTDCHGLQHRMKVRTVRWDKCTGELLRQK